MTIGITGGIGSGKSYVSKWLASHYSIPVYDCDREAKRLMLKPAIRRALTRLVGAQAYQPDGQLNKPFLAEYLFSSPEHTAAVNAIVHPAVKRDFILWAKRHPGLVIVESAILIEANFLDAADQVIVVEAPLPLRLQRVMERDGVTEQQVLARIARQLTDEERRRCADLIIVNDGTDFGSQLSSFIEELNNKK